MSREPLILGLENELTLGIHPPEKRAQAPVLVKLIEALRSTVPSVLCTELAGPFPGLMLGSNGARIYVDGPSYLESATAEALTPEEILAHQRANERLILRALSQAARSCSLAAGDARLSRIVTDYATGEPHYCGQHLNILTRRLSAPEMIPFLTPFLVTRFYAGAGGWGPTGLVMTHKNRAVRCVSSHDTRENRGIINLKEENLGPPPFKRLHLVHGDATMSDLATYLTVGCTALVCKMVDDGVCVGAAFTLDDPIRALRLLDNDPTWTRPLRLRCGRKASGLEIQEHYLKVAERYTKRNAEPWMARVVGRWRWAIENLRQGPKRLARSLDPYIKCRLYARILAEQGLSLEAFGRWCPALALLEPHLNGTVLSRGSLREFLRERLPMVPFWLLADRMASQRLPWDQLPRMQALLQHLKALEFQFHDIGENGLYWRMRAQGICDSKILGEQEILAAMNTPPDTRAKARAKAICEVWRETNARADWMSVTAARGTLQLTDPFKSEAQWVAPPATAPTK